MTPPDPTEAAIEAMARAMKPNHFAVFDSGFTSKNYIDQRAFLNAEKAVKRARKDARAAFYALHGAVRVVPTVATAEMIDAFERLDKTYGFRLDTANAAGDLTKPKE